ncbi:MAG: VOC family protein [SAR324 cluster bacterium]|nr:VOC family protein [SAR324 cluster bacterium]
MISSLDHLVMTVHDLAKTIEFYTNIGMEEVTFSGGRKALAFGTQKINLHSFGAEIEPHAHFPTRGSLDLCFLLDSSVSFAKEKLEEKGIEFFLGPVPRTGAQGSMTSIYLYDPDGNLIELSSYDQ